MDTAEEIITKTQSTRGTRTRDVLWKTQTHTQKKEQWQWTRNCLQQKCGMHGIVSKTHLLYDGHAATNTQQDGIITLCVRRSALGANATPLWRCFGVVQARFTGAMWPCRLLQRGGLLLRLWLHSSAYLHQFVGVFVLVRMYGHDTVHGREKKDEQLDN